MTIVDIGYEVYKCPHCSGYLAIRMQCPYTKTGCSATLEHWRELPEWLDKSSRDNIIVIDVEEAE